MGASILDLATSRLVNYAHRHNIAVQYWTINDTEDMQHLKDKNEKLKQEIELKNTYLKKVRSIELN